MKPIGEVKMQSSAIYPMSESIEQPDLFIEALFETSDEEIRAYAEEVAREIKEELEVPRNTPHVTVHDIDHMVEKASRLTVLKIFDIDYKEEGGA